MLGLLITGTPYALGIERPVASRVKEISSRESGNQSQPGGSLAHSASLLFLGGIRNADVIQAQNPQTFYNYYVGGPSEPSLASVNGNALLGYSSPLTTISASADNARTATITYTVKPGDMPSVIAASFGITTNTLLWANNLSDGQFIKPGDELIILPVSGVRYKIRAGDTISGIAQEFKGEADKIIVFNNLAESGDILEGEYIIIPDGEMPIRRTSKRYAAKYSPYSVNLDDYFSHPTAGAGYKSRGIHPHNAVDIAAPCWTLIYAAADGTVAVADGYGWNGGYGKYIKITHNNSTQTLYAHNIQIEVKVGQSVRQGELIAYMGSTGKSSGCHVHWEVYGALNPLR